MTDQQGRSPDPSRPPHPAARTSGTHPQGGYKGTPPPQESLGGGGRQPLPAGTTGNPTRAPRAPGGAPGSRSPSMSPVGVPAGVLGGGQSLDHRAYEDPPPPTPTPVAAAARPPQRDLHAPNRTATERGMPAVQPPTGQGGPPPLPQRPQPSSAQPNGSGFPSSEPVTAPVAMPMSEPAPVVRRSSSGAIPMPKPLPESPVVSIEPRSQDGGSEDGELGGRERHNTTPEYQMPRGTQMGLKAYKAQERAIILHERPLGVSWRGFFTALACAVGVVGWGMATEMAVLRLSRMNAGWFTAPSVVGLLLFLVLTRVCSVLCSARVDGKVTPLRLPLTLTASLAMFIAAWIVAGFQLGLDLQQVYVAAFVSSLLTGLLVSYSTNNSQ